ncbi:MAG TPA: hypothetical protein PKV01_04135, partial [Anaerolineales bacterium]|nr:hypothetical protein [Anaerolineales bacterium]
MFKRNAPPTETSQPIQAVERITSVLGSGLIWHGSINGAGGQAQVIVFDLADGAATRAALEAELEHAPIDVLVHNAGIH